MKAQEEKSDKEARQESLKKKMQHDKEAMDHPERDAREKAANNDEKNSGGYGSRDYQNEEE
jgi:hypothetical protein